AAACRARTAANPMAAAIEAAISPALSRKTRTPSGNGAALPVAGVLGFASVGPPELVEVRGLRGRRGLEADAERLGGGNLDRDAARSRSLVPHRERAAAARQPGEA